MSSSSTALSGPLSHGVLDLAAGCVSAGVLNIPTYPGFAAKTALQRELPMPSLNREMFKQALKSSPSIGFAVGTQMATENLVAKAITKYRSKDGEPTPSSNMTEKLASAAVVGCLSAYPYAVYNKQLAGTSFGDSLKGHTPKVLGSLAVREVCYVSSLTLSGSVGEFMKNKCGGNNQIVEQASIFGTGVIGSLAGHPADSVATRWQNKLPVINPLKALKVEGLRQLYRGAATKAVAVGAFNIGYTALEKGLQSLYKPDRSL